MKLMDYFQAFLTNTVNINDDRLRQLKEHVDAIVTALKADAALGSLIISHIPQGSWAHRTIIKPLPGKEFDADFLLLIEEQDRWSPAEYLDELYAAFGRNATYKSKRTLKNRCVRITYANDCHVDVVVFVRQATGRQVIVNHDEDDWEDTNPEGFTSWMQTKDGIMDGDLRRVIRLMKYLRDYKGTFSIKSVILTTLLGGVVEEWRKVTDPAHYSDVPTSLRSIVKDLDEWLQARPTLPIIEDPSCSGTNFNHRWTEAGYTNFRGKIHSYAAKIDAAYLKPDRDKSLELWQEIFGEDFKKPATSTSSGRFGPVVPPAAQVGRGG
jgi:hypothetical protein